MRHDLLPPHSLFTKEKRNSVLRLKILNLDIYLIVLVRQYYWWNHTHAEEKIYDQVTIICLKAYGGSHDLFMLRKQQIQDIDNKSCASIVQNSEGYNEESNFRMHYLNVHLLGTKHKKKKYKHDVASKLGLGPCLPTLYFAE